MSSRGTTRDRGTRGVTKHGELDDAGLNSKRKRAGLYQNTVLGHATGPSATHALRLGMTELALRRHVFYGARRRSVRADRPKIIFTFFDSAFEVSREVHELFETARNLSGYCGIAEVVQRALKEYVAKRRPEKVRARKTPPAEPWKSYVPKPLRREVMKRDEYQCSFVSADETLRRRSASFCESHSVRNLVVHRGGRPASIPDPTDLAQRIAHAALPRADKQTVTGCRPLRGVWRCARVAQAAAFNAMPKLHTLMLNQLAQCRSRSFAGISSGRPSVATTLFQPSSAAVLYACDSVGKLKTAFTK